MKWLSYFPGLCYCVALSFFASFLSFYLPQVGHISLSLILGILVSNLFQMKNIFQAGVSFSEKKLLEVSIALLGLTMSYQDLSFLNFWTVLSLFVMILFVIGSSLFLGKILNFPSSFSLLIGVGNAICGSAAIMATSKVLSPAKKEVVRSLAIIHLIGIFALFVFPILFVNLDDSFSSFLIGGSLQAMGHVVASTALLDPSIANMAVAVKMLRIFFLTPLILGMCFYASRKKRKDLVSKTKFPLPLYIVFFVGFIILTNTYSFSAEFLSLSKKISRLLLSFSMVALGSNIKILELKKGFGKYTGFAALLFLMQLMFLYFCYQVII